MVAKKVKPIDSPFRKHPFRRAVLRGLGVVLPPLLTIVIFIVVGNTVAVYVLKPLEGLARYTLVLTTNDIREANELDPVESGDQRLGMIEGVTYVQVGGGSFVPNEVYNTVDAYRSIETMPATAMGVYQRYVTIRWLQRQWVIPIFVCGFIVLLYLLGRFLAAGVGNFFWSNFERGIGRLPLIRNVYSSVKQVTDFLFSQRDVEYTHVVAIEYPRKGIWSIGLVTGESLLDIYGAAGEAVLSVLIPTSPMPVTGYTVTIRKSETVDLDLTIDQAFQFIVSCGVVIPPQQLREVLEGRDGDSTGVDADNAALSAPAGDSS